MNKFKVYPVCAWEEKKTWKVVTDKRILSLWNEVVEEAIARGLLEPNSVPPLRWSNRLSRCIAFCYQHKATDGVRSCVVLSDALLVQDDDFIRDTMCHELGHAVSPIGAHHDYRWYTAARAIGLKWNYIPSIKEGSVNSKKFIEAIAALHSTAKSTYKYQLVCSKCGREFNKYKTLAPSLKKGKWACGKCHQVLDVQNLETGEICWNNSNRKTKS